MKNYYDCIVIGFGTAGSIAAIAAAKQGASVLVLEPLTAPGGTHTLGTVAGWYGQKANGLMEELETVTDADTADFFPAKPELGKYRLEDTALALGVKIRYQAFPVAAIRKAGRICGVEWLEEGKRFSACAHTLLDGTAEGYFFQLAGAKLTKGRESDQLFQPFSCTINRFVPERGVSFWNYDAGRIDPYHAVARTEKILVTETAYRQNDYAENSTAIAPAALPGIREGGHIVPPGGQQTLQEFFSSAPSQEVLFCCRSNIDTHANDLALESDLFQEWNIVSSMWGFVCTFPIEKRALFAADAPGILACCRCLGIDHDTGHAVRMNGHMGRLGEVCGILAALAAKKQIPAEDVPYSDLLPYLQRELELCEDNRVVTSLSRDEIRAALDSDKPGPGLWSVRCNPDAVSNQKLIEWMTGAPAGSMLRCHAAFALALRRDPAALEELREMAAARDPFRPTFSRKYNHAHGYASVCALGLMRDAGSVDLLGSLLKEENPGDLRYEYHTYAVGALLRIGEAHPGEREKIAALFRMRGEDPAWYLEARLKGTANTMMRMDPIFRAAMAAALDRWQLPHHIGPFSD